MTESLRRLRALGDAARATLLLCWIVLLCGLALYAVTSPITLTVVLARLFVVGCG